MNVHKDTIKLQSDELNQDCHLVTFTFDALVDGRYFTSFHSRFSNMVDGFYSMIVLQIYVYMSLVFALDFDKTDFLLYEIVY